MMNKFDVIQADADRVTASRAGNRNRCFLKQVKSASLVRIF